MSKSRGFKIRHFFTQAFDIIKNKNRIKLNLKRKLFYLKNQNKTYELLENLIQFWISKDVIFVKLEDECKNFV